MDRDQVGLLHPFYLYRLWPGDVVGLCKKRGASLGVALFIINGVYQILKSKFDFVYVRLA